MWVSGFDGLGMLVGSGLFWVLGWFDQVLVVCDLLLGGCLCNAFGVVGVHAACVAWL